MISFDIRGIDVTGEEEQGRFPSTRKLVVGTKQAEPFAIKNSDGTWSGVSIDLWREIATELHLDYELHEWDLEGLLNAINRTGPEDLPKVRVGTIAGSTSELYLRDQHISYQSYKTSLDGFRAIASKEIDAMVYDAPILRYLSNTELKGTIKVLPVTFERQDYGIALPDNSSLREPIICREPRRTGQ